MPSAPFQHDITIDLGKIQRTVQLKSREIFIFKLDDNLGHQLRMHVKVDGVTKDLTGWSGKVYFVKEDLTTCFEACTVEDYTEGIICCDLTAQTLSCAGKVTYELVLYGSSNEIVKGPTKYFYAEEYIMDEAALESTSEYAGLTSIISEVTAIDTKVGLLADLTTTVKTSIVNAINSLKSALDTLTSNHGDLQTEVTNARSGEATLLARLSALVTLIGTKAPSTQTDTWHDYTGVTWSNSWTNYGGSNAFGYTKDNLGYVHLRGLIKSGTIGQIALLLPAGYRPAQSVQVATVSLDLFAEVLITSAGNLSVLSGNNTWVSLDSIPPFKAA